MGCRAHEIVGLVSETRNIASMGTAGVKIWIRWSLGCFRISSCALGVEVRLIKVMICLDGTESCFWDEFGVVNAGVMST